MEQYYVFLKDDRVMNITVFASNDKELADRIAQEQGFDGAIWVGEDKPAMFSTWDGSIFINPTLDDLYDLGIAQENTAMMEARVVSEALEENN